MYWVSPPAPATAQRCAELGKEIAIRSAAGRADRRAGCPGRRFDGQLVQIEGKLVERLQRPGEQILTIQSRGTVFNASLPIRAASPILEPGTVLRLTGICAVEVEQSYDLILPRAFRLLLRSPADAVILSKPPWLTSDRVVPILMGVGLLMLAAVAWAVLLRKRVRAQTNALRAQTMQLQAAHMSTRKALEQVCAAEALDVDSKNILELIARMTGGFDCRSHRRSRRPAHRRGGSAILLAAPEGSRVCAVPALPSCWLEILGGIQMSSISFSPQFRDPQEFTDNPAWAGFLASQPGTRFKAFCSAPIVVESTTVGAIVAFFRYAKPSAEARDETLGLWSNIASLALERGGCTTSYPTARSTILSPACRIARCSMSGWKPRLPPLHGAAIWWACCISTWIRSKRLTTLMATTRAMRCSNMPRAAWLIASAAGTRWGASAATSLWSCCRRWDAGRTLNTLPARSPRPYGNRSMRSTSGFRSVPVWE